MPSRGQSLTIAYVAWDTSAQTGRPADASNHTLRWIKDGIAAPPSPSPAEVDATNAPGVYKLTLTAGECTCHVGVLCGKSSTPNVWIAPVMVLFEQLPVAQPGFSGGLPLYNDVHANYLILETIKPKVLSLPSEPAGVGSAMALLPEERAALADVVLARSVSHAETAAAEHSLCTVVLAALESALAGDTWTIRRSDGNSVHVVKTVTRDPHASPITGVN